MHNNKNQPSQECLIAQETCRNIMQKWALSDDEQAQLLPEINHPEFLDSASYLLNIHAAVASLFSNPNNTYGFVKMVNNDPTFNGTTPLTHMMDKQMGGMKDVLDYLQKLAL